MVKKTNLTNNPLRIAVDGTKLLFQKAPMAAIVLAFLSAITAGSYFGEPAPTETDDSLGMPEAALDPATIIMIAIVVAVFIFGALVIGSLVAGIFAHTSAEIAKGREVTFRQSLKAISERLWSFVWLQLLIIVKVILWSLLLVVPGIIMAVRYSLASLSFFDDEKKLKGNAAIQDSLQLTKGAWLTTFASQMFFNIITLGMISPIIDTGSKAMLYRQFNELQKADQPKPKAHTLSWVTLGLSILIVAIALTVKILTEANTAAV